MLQYTLVLSVGVLQVGPELAPQQQPRAEVAYDRRCHALLQVRGQLVREQRGAAAVLRAQTWARSTPADHGVVGQLAAVHRNTADARYNGTSRVLAAAAAGRADAPPAVAVAAARWHRLRAVGTSVGPLVVQARQGGWRRASPSPLLPARRLAPPRGRSWMLVPSLDCCGRPLLAAAALVLLGGRPAAAR